MDSNFLLRQKEKILLLNHHFLEVSSNDSLGYYYIHIIACLFNQCIGVDVEDLPGKVPPTGFFDPLNLSAGKSADTIKKWREAELKHGRVCMLASLGILVQESFNPMFGGKIIGPAINHFQQAEALLPPFWYLILGSIGIVEGYTISKVIILVLRTYIK